jgi:histone H3/H4
MANGNKAIPTFVRESTMKDYLSNIKVGNQQGFRSKGELADAVNKAVQEVLDKAAARCTANGRSTVGPDDL